MRRLLTALIVLALALPCMGGMYVRRTGNTAVANPYADILFWLNFENDTTCTTYTMATSGAAPEYSAGDSVGDLTVDCSASDPGVFVKTGAAKNGTYGLHSQGGATNWENIQFAISGGDIISPSSGRIGFWVYRTAASVETFTRSQGGTGGFGCGFSGSTVSCTYTGTTGGAIVVTSGAFMPTATWRFFEFGWDDTTDEIKLILTEEDGTPHETTTSSPFTAASGWTLLNVGIQYTTATNLADNFVDQVMVTNDYSRSLAALRAQNGSPR